MHAEHSSNSSCFGYYRYVFKKQDPGSEKGAKRQRSSSVPDDSPEGKRTRAGDSDVLLKSVAQLEQSNQVRDCLLHLKVVPRCCKRLVYAMPLSSLADVKHCR